jgi:hypothetical protein
MYVANMATASRAFGVLRGGLASAGALVAAFGMLHFDWHELLVTRWLPTTLLAASAALVHTRLLASQALVRALWAATLLLSVVNLAGGPARERGLSALMAAGMATALLAAGRKGLGAQADAGPFKPVAFRGLLLLSLGMALTDAHSLLFYGVAWLERFGRVTPPLVLGGMLTGVAVGLFRLRAWALLAAIAVNAVVLGSALTGVLMVPPPVLALLTVTAAAQLVVPLPILRAIVRRTDAQQPAAPEPEPARVQLRVATAAHEGVDRASEIEGLSAEADALPCGSRRDTT